MRVRDEVRGALGLSYSPSATFMPFGGFYDFALLQATVDCTPSDVRQVATAVEATAARFATEGATAEELEGARGILRRQLRRAFHQNDFLVNILKRTQEQPGRIEEVVALRDGLVDKLTLEEINIWAAKILPVTNCRTVAIVPKAFVGIFDTAK